MDGAIRRPDAPNHFMVLKPIRRRVVIRLPDGRKLAESVRATRLLESGKTLYDPVIYLPQQDLATVLTRQENTTHCPLKGDASYYMFCSDGHFIADLAWSYDQPLEFAQDIAGLIAFYGDKVVTEEHPT